MSVDLQGHMQKAMAAAGLPSTKVADNSRPVRINVRSDDYASDSQFSNYPYDGGIDPMTKGSTNAVLGIGPIVGKPANKN